MTPTVIVFMKFDFHLPGGSNATRSLQYWVGSSTAGKIIYETHLGLAKALRSTLLAVSIFEIM